MKSAFGLFMSVYLLLLSVLPCADGCQLLRSSDGPIRIEASLASDHHDHDTDRPQGDLCSPLCSCACCGTVMSQPPIFAFSFTPPLPASQLRHSLRVPALPSVALSTWQPPQLG